MESVFSGSGFSVPSCIMYPKNWISVKPKNILSAPAFKPLLASILSILPALLAHSSWVSPPVAKSSINAAISSYRSSSAIALFIVAWKYGGPFLGPKGMTNQTKSSSGVMHPSFATLSRSTGIYQNPDLRSYFA